MYRAFMLDATLPLRLRVLVGGLLVLAVVAAFWPLTNNTTFVLDDAVNVERNPQLADADSNSLKQFWQKPYLRLYIPVTYSVWSLYAMASGKEAPNTPEDARILHLLNLALHAANVLLVFSLLLLLSESLWGAFFGALLFALHPVQVEAVAWVTELKTVLAAFFALSAARLFLASQHHWEQGGMPLWHLLSIPLLVLGVLAKPLAVVVVPMLFLLMRFLFHASWKRSILTLAPHGAVCALVVLLTTRAQPPNFLLHIPALWERLLVFLDATGFYLAKLLLPLPLLFDYGRTPQMVLEQWPYGWQWLALPLVGGALVALSVKRKGLRVYLLCLGVFVLGFLPVSGLVPFSFQRISTVADRYMYFALLGPSLAVALFLARPLAPQVRRLTMACFAVAAVILLLATFRQTQLWSDEVSLAENTFAHNNESGFAFNTLLSHMPAGQKKFQLAKAWLQEHPGDQYSVTHFVLSARELARQNTLPAGDQDKARNLVERGLAAVRSQDMRAGYEAFAMAIVAAPRNLRALNNYGCLQLHLGQNIDAQHILAWALQLAPETDKARAAVLNNLGIALYNTSHHEQAVTSFSRAVALDDSQAINNNLAKLRAATAGATVSELTYIPLF